MRSSAFSLSLWDSVFLWCGGCTVEHPGPDVALEPRVTRSRGPQPRPQPTTPIVRRGEDGWGGAAGRVPHGARHFPRRPPPMAGVPASVAGPAAWQVFDGAVWGKLGHCLKVLGQLGELAE